MKQDTTQATPFELVYGRTATLSVEIEVSTYPTEPITEENFKNTLLRRTYDLMETLENKRQRTANNIQKAQEKQKKNTITNYQINQLNSGLETKKFNPKWNGPFHIEKILGNGAYKLRLDSKILTKAAYRDRLKPYHYIASASISNISQLGVQRILVQPKKIPQDLEPIIIIDNKIEKQKNRDYRQYLFTSPTNFSINPTPRDGNYHQLTNHLLQKYSKNTTKQSTEKTEKHGQQDHDQDKIGHKRTTSSRITPKIYQKNLDLDRPEILLNKAMDTVTNNQLGKITNAQFKELRTQITQVILNNKIQKILQEGESNELDFDRAQY
ncbi:hypothetical protein G9A89_007547 [Geosiphon pyriformis]|nr:hypothetical protein G9A89_007547 [Geosiphon pyriformis]